MDLLRMAFERDDPFTMDKGRCFFNVNTHDVEWAGEFMGIDEVPYIESDDWIEVPGTPHGEWHEVFKQWCSESGVTYKDSIGLSLKSVDESTRQSWFSRKYEYAEKKLMNG